MQELERRGDRPVALARPGSGAGDALEAAGHEVAREDLRRPGDGLRSLLAEADAVYHLASGIAGGWRATFDTNVTATENLVDALREAAFRGRLVHVSSFSVYGLNQLPPGSLVDESTPIEPEPWRRDDYAWTKVLQERVIRRLEGEEGPELVVVRPGTIYGPERRFHYRLGRPLGDGALLVLGGRNTLPLTYVENTASLLAEAGRHPAARRRGFQRGRPRRAEPVRVCEALARCARRAARRDPVPAGSAADGRAGPSASRTPHGRTALTTGVPRPLRDGAEHAPFPVGSVASDRAARLAAAGGARGGAQPDVRLISTGSAGSGSGSGQSVSLSCSYSVIAFS